MKKNKTESLYRANTDSINNDLTLKSVIFSLNRQVGIRIIQAFGGLPLLGNRKEDGPTLIKDSGIELSQADDPEELKVSPQQYEILIDSGGKLTSLGWRTQPLPMNFTQDGRIINHEVITEAGLTDDFVNSYNNKILRGQ